MIPMTRSYVNSLRGNLSIGIGNDQKSLEPDLAGSHADSDKFNNYLFQILIFEGKEVEAKLVTDTRKNLNTFLGVPEQSANNFDSFSRFPSVGAKVREDFLHCLSKDVPEIHQSECATVRFLKQTRLLSQLMAAMWLDDKPDGYKEEIHYARKILREYCAIPKPHNVKGVKEGKKITEGLTEYINDQVKNGKKDLYLIKPEHIGYSSISLALLLCGQAYYKKNSQWKRIWKPIFSSYEMVYEYALDLSWDTFYATRVDIFQPGAEPNPPYTKVTLGYPPKPITSQTEDDKYDLSQEALSKWFMAKEISTKDNEGLPFYPTATRVTDKDGKEQFHFKDDKLQFVMPPIPYIPLSTV